MTTPKHWNLGAKLTLVATPFLVLALLAVSLTLWMSWQLEGGAAAVNEAGRLRMQAYRLSLSISTAASDKIPAQLAEFDSSLALLRNGDADRPLFMPWDPTVAGHFSQVERDWSHYRDRWTRAPAESVVELPLQTSAFAARVDALVTSIEAHMSRWTALLHLLQAGLMALAILGAIVLLFTGYLFVLEPLGLLKQAIQRIEGGDLGARVARTTTDEFGTLAEGFNGMADHLQLMYQSLETKVAEKTAQLEERRERLEALYDVTALVANATTLESLARGFAARARKVARADGVAVRWSDETNQRYLMLASEGLPQPMIDAEQCLGAGDCHCAMPSAFPGARVIEVRKLPAPMPHCVQAGFETVVSVPIRLHYRLMGEVDLFYHARIKLTDAERSLLDVLAAHLASAIENLRLNALEKEAAIAQERSFIARELHDSIAQSLAFLKIQVQLMRDALNSGNQAQVAQVLSEIDTGVRESYGDVRELLMHFRTRTNAEDIEPALTTTLRKFEHQSGMKAVLQMQGHGMPLPPDLQVQVLHIVQEALSNVRKHAGARQVWLDVQQQPQWRLEVRDDGIGFEPAQGPPDETHVGLRIMAERAERIGATLQVISSPGRGTSIVLTLPQPQQQVPVQAAPTTAQPLLH